MQKHLCGLYGLLIEINVSLYSVALIFVLNLSVKSLGYKKETDVPTLARGLSRPQKKFEVF